MMKRPPSEDFSLKEMNQGGKVSGDKLASSYDLVEQMQYLYVHVIKAKDLTGKDVSGSYDPFVEVRLGNCKGNTRRFEKKLNPEWNQVFAFSKDRIQASVLEVTVKDKDFGEDDFIGRVPFNLTEVPKCVPPDRPLAPKWYRLEDQKADKVKGEIMLAVWMGTQADEVFPEAWHSDAAAVSRTIALANIQSKVYFSPKLWYLRVNVIEAQDLQPTDKERYPEVYVKAILGNQSLRTQISQSQSIYPMWNEDLMFVAAEPFEEPLILSVEDRNAPNKDEVLGRCRIPLQYVDRRLDNKPVNSRWYNLEKLVVVEGDQKKETNFVSWIHLRICLEGGYHVLDESMQYKSDLRPTATQLWKQRIGVLELGILNAQGLLPMKTKDGRRRTDAYCIAKYGQKWVRTRTIIDSFTPKWNEQYAWEVFDLCTVVTIGVFDNFHFHRGQKSGPGRDSKIGKVRFWLSSLDKDRVYSHSYPLLVLRPNGVKKMGEIHLAIRFTCSSLLNMMHMYSQPLLPKMHYICPLSVTQLDNLRHHATQIVSMRLGRAEPPLTKEVVEYMLDVGFHMWSMRRSKANFFRMMAALNEIGAVWKWFDQVCNWKNPITTVLVHVVFIILVRYPEPILPLILLSLFLNGAWSYRRRPRKPLHMDTRLSHADASYPDELDEEFDTFPTSRPNDIVRMRYDRLRISTGRIQMMVSNLAEHGDRLQSLRSWRDPWATAVFMTFCLVAAIVLCLTPYKVVLLLVGLYLLRHPRFRQKHPSVPLNFFRRLPARTHCML